MHYLDNGATTPLCEEVRTALCEGMGQFGNPSSLHGLGLAAQLQFEEDAKTVAAALGGDARGRLLFTSGGTEANNLCLQGAARALRRRGDKLLVSAVEHASVLDTAKALEKEGFTVEYLPPESLTPEGVAQRVDSRTILVSIMYMNNETGNLYPVTDIAKAVKRKAPQALFHSDMVQSFLKAPVKLKNSGIDFVSVSGHKLHAPKGIGALYMASGTRLHPLFYGGGQQGKTRPGTESTLLAHGFAAAVKAAQASQEQSAQHAAALNRLLHEQLQGVEPVVFNTQGEASPYTVNLSVPGIRSETMLHFLEARGVYVSSGSACAGGALSHVLAAYGLPAERIDSALRVSFSRMNTEEDVLALTQGIKDGIASLARKGRKA